MNKIIRPRHLALTALAAVLIAPITQVQAREGRFHIPFLPDGVYTIDTINGNDVRDTRDSTISRNDVPLDGRDGMSNSPAYMEPAHSDRTSSYPYESGVVTSQAPNALPATGVHDAGNGTVTAGRDSATIHGDQADAAPVGAGATTAERDRLDRRTNQSPNQAVMPEDGGGEVGVPGSTGTSAQTDSFEQNRDTAAGVESTRGAGGNGSAGTAGGGAAGTGAGAGAGGAGAGGAGAGAGGGGAGR